MNENNRKKPKEECLYFVLLTFRLLIYVFFTPSVLILDNKS